MKTKTLLTVILSILLVSCTPVSTPTPIETLVPTATITLTPVPTITITPSPVIEIKTLKEVSQILGVQIGFTFQSDDLGSYRAAYESLAARHFAAIHSLNELSNDFIVKYGYEGIDLIVQRAHNANQVLITPPIFDRVADNSYLEGKSASVVEADMRKRLQEILPHLKLATEAQTPVYIITANELIDTSVGYGRFDPDPTNVYVHAFGKDAIYQVMKITLDEAQKAGIDIWGGKVFFMQGMTGLLGGGEKLSTSLQFFHEAKQRIADDYQVTYDKVPFGIAAQDHASLHGFRGHENVATLEIRTDSLVKVAAEGQVVIIESELNDGTASESVEYWLNTIKAAKASGVKAVILWTGIRDCTVQPEEGWCNKNADLFDDNGMPTSVYENLLAELIKLAEK